MCVCVCVCVCVCERERERERERACLLSLLLFVVCFVVDAVVGFFPVVFVYYITPVA